MKSIIRFWQDLNSASALEELSQLAQFSSKLGFKASMDGSAAKRACGLLSTEYGSQLSSNAAIVKRLTQSQPSKKELVACNAYFYQVFLALTSISPPWKAWVMERTEAEFKKPLDKLTSAFLQTCGGRNMSLEGSIEALKYQQDLLDLWGQTPPTLPKQLAAEDKAILHYRGARYRLNALDELLTLAAQAKFYAGKTKQLSIEHTVEFILPKAEVCASQILSLIKKAPWWPEEQCAQEVLVASELVQAKAARFFLREQELGELTEEEFTRILEARCQLHSALSDCIQCSIDAHKAQLNSTARIIQLTEVMRERIETTKNSRPGAIRL